MLTLEREFTLIVEFIEELNNIDLNKYERTYFSER